MHVERLIHYPAFTRFCLLLRQDHYIEPRQPVCMSTKAFPNSAFYLVSGDGRAHRLFGNRHSQPRVLPAIPASKYHKLRIPGAPGGLENPVEIRGVVEPELALKTAQADSRFLPLARRALSIRRPALVRIRARKPCRRLRLMLLGWYVRFIGVLFGFRNLQAFYLFVCGVVNAQRQLVVMAGAAAIPCWPPLKMPRRAFLEVTC